MHQYRNAWIIGIVLALAMTAIPAVAADAAGVVNVNTASVDELALLPRVGPALAQRIVDFREENGGLEKPEELLLVRGIGDKTFELMAPYVAVSGDTTLTEKVRSTASASGEDEE